MRLIQIDYSKRVYGLDIFRAIAILLVVLGHAGTIAGDIFFWIPSIPLINGVELFFVLSGFLIGSILIKLLENNQLKTISDLFSFWKRRWYRTLPTYYLLLFVNYIFVNNDIIKGDIHQFSIKFIFFLQNFSTGFYEFFWESWSLSIEEWFYILLPLFLFLFQFLLSKKQVLLLAIILFITLPIILRFNTLDDNLDPFWLDTSLKKIVIYRLDAIVFGVLIAYIKYYYISFYKKYKMLLFVFGFIIVYTNLLIHHEPNDFYTKIFSFSVSSFGACLLIPFADSVKKFKYPIIGKSITFISVISYSMYLINLLIAQIIEYNFPPTNTTENVIFYSLYWITTLIISYLLYRFFENPMTNLREK